MAPKLKTCLTLPPFDLLISLLGTSKEQLQHESTVQVRADVLLQIIGAAVLGAAGVDRNLDREAKNLIARYFSGLLPDEFAVDPEFYLATNPDVAEAAHDDRHTFAKEHFVRYGVIDGRTPNNSVRHLFVQWMKAKIIDWRWDERRTGPLEVLKLGGPDLTRALEALQLKPEADGNAGDIDLAKAYATAALSASEENKAEIFAWLAANGQRSALEILLPQILKVTGAGALARIAKALDDHTRRTMHIVVERELVLKRFLGAPAVKTFANGELDAFANHFQRGNAAQLLARYATESQAPRLRRTVSTYGHYTEIKHIFLGFFGQLRFPEMTLTKLVRQVQEAAPGANLSIGLSSWNQIGMRQLQNEDPIQFALSQLPAAFGEFCIKNNIKLFSDFCAVFPSIGGRLRSRTREQSEISVASLAKMCGFPIDCDLAPESAYLEGAGAAIASEFVSDSFMLNAGRMWNRIAGLRPSFERANGSASPVTHVVLVRPDLQVTGDLRRCFEQVSQAESGTLALVDYDARAMYLDSVGDRIFIGGPQIADRLFDGEAVMQEVLRDKEGQTPIYRWFLVPHRFPQALLYEFGADIRPVPLNELSVKIYRGQITVEELSGEIAADIMLSTYKPAAEYLSAMTYTKTY